MAKTFHPLAGVAVLLGPALALLAPAAQGAKAPPSHARSSRVATLALPVSFAENRGQVDRRYPYVGEGGNFRLLVAPTETRLEVGGSGMARSARSLRVRLVGASSRARITALDPLPGKFHYYRGANPAHWQTDVPTFARVRCAAVYPGVDLVHYGRKGQLEYDFELKPGADPRQIRLAPDGDARVRLRPGGDLEIATAATTATWRRPVAYQDGPAGRRPVPCRYAPRGDGSVGFQVGAYDPSRPLVIDPVLEYSTTAVGGGDVAVDALDQAYVTHGSTITKLNATGSAILYHTTIVGAGGTGPDWADIALDPAGRVFVSGSTTIPDLPLRPDGNQHQGAEDACLAGLEASGQLRFTRYYGGSDAELNFRLTLDDAGAIWLAGRSASPDLPLVNPLQGHSPGDPNVTGAFLNGYVARFPPDGSGILFATYLGGDRWDEVRALEVAPGAGEDATLYLGGRTESTDFPFLNGPYGNVPPPPDSGDPRFEEGDAFVMKLRVPANAAPEILYSTSLGGERHDHVRGLALDAAGRIYTTGFAYQPYPHTDLTGNLDDSYRMFAIRLDEVGGAPVIGYSRLIGGAYEDFCEDIAVDPTGRACVVGSTNSLNFPLKDPLRSQIESYQRHACIVVLEPTGTTLFSTYFGGGTSSGANGVAFGGNGDLYVVGGYHNEGRRYPFPRTAGALPGESTGYTARISLRPSSPANLAATTPASSEIRLTWANPTSNQDAIHVERSLDGVAFAPIATLPGATTSYTDSGLARKTKYWYRLRGENEFGLSPYSAVVSNTTRR